LQRNQVNMSHCFTSGNNKTGTPTPLLIILDTDMGPDCDDAGALAMLNVFCLRGKTRMLAIGHCTSSPWGAPCIDAINRYYGHLDIPVGTLKKPGFLDAEEHQSYNRPVARQFPNRYASDPDSVPDVVSVYRQVLVSSPPASVTFCAIGPLTNLADLLNSSADNISPLTGMELVKDRASRLVAMGGWFPEEDSGTPRLEFNLHEDPTAARRVLSDWPTPVFLSGFETGEKILTGAQLVAEGPTSHPVREAYRLYPQTDKGNRMSWDLAALHYAACPKHKFWRVSTPGRITLTEEGASSWQADPAGKHRVVYMAVAPETIAAEFDRLMLELP
jgi:hypothetical protein